MNLSQLIVRAWREIGFGFDTTATGGTTATVVDANTKYTVDNSLLNGSIVITRDAGGAGAAPEGEFGKITGFTASTKTFALATGAFTVAPANGDSVFFANPKVSLQQMIAAANDGLRDLGFLDGLDTSLTYVGGQEEYTLPVTLKAGGLVDVRIQWNSGDVPVSILGDCSVEPSAAGATAKLWVRDRGYDGLTLRIIYNGLHAPLTAFNSSISETIPEALAVAAAIDKALAWYVSKRGESALGTMAVQRWNDAKQTLASTKIEHPVQRVKKATKWFSVGRSSNYPGDQTIYNR